MQNLIISHARQGNLKDCSLTIPKQQLVVVAGVSGSGKSTLILDVLYQECQRQYLEAMAFQGIHKPDVERIKNTSPAIQIGQRSVSRNPRSTLGTVTLIYTELRMIYEKLHERCCPYCGKRIKASQCREVTEKKENEFRVWIDCSECGKRMAKLTRTEFSFNTREGACPECEGMGQVLSVNLEAVLDDSKSLEDGAVIVWEGKYLQFQTEALYHTFDCLGLDRPVNRPLADYSARQRQILIEGTDRDAEANAGRAPKTAAEGRFEGIIPMLKRRLKDKGGLTDKLKPYFIEQECPVCHGEQLNAQVREAEVMGTRLPELNSLSLTALRDWLHELAQNLTESERLLVQVYLDDLETKIGRLVKIGLGYLTLNRQTMTLSGGEAQRIQLAAAMDSEITGILYLLDEPTAGLHPKDTEGLIAVLKELRDRGNSVIVIEHDPDVMKEADFLIEIGPGSGIHGGELIAQGSLKDLMNNPSSVTGQSLKRGIPLKTQVRQPRGKIEIRNASLHNLKHLNAKLPCGVLTSVTGVSGSGKSTLIFDLLAGGTCDKAEILGMEQFDQIITLNQDPMVRMKRSSAATWTGLAAEIRKLFAALPDAKEAGFSEKMFSANVPGGRCERCEGLGTITSNLLFFEDIEVPCPECGGRQFQEAVLAVRCHGYSIHDVLKLTADEAVSVFADQKKIMSILSLMQEVGLGYLPLGQPVTTLSGGEVQRLKLLKELLDRKKKQSLILLDEPTAGLHMQDVGAFLILLNKLVDQGSTVICVEHNLQVISASDWIVDMGPGGGEHGGRIIASGTPAQLRSLSSSMTGQFL